MKKAIKCLVGLIGLSLLVFGFYLYKLHTLAIEGNNIFALRCTKVNPPLISYKNSFLKFADCLKNPDKYASGEMMEFFNIYVSGMRAYVPEETKWLEMQQEFINRWDFKLIEPWYIKQASEYQWKMYEAYRDDAEYMLETYEAGGADENITAKVKDARKRRDEYEQKYYEFFDRALEIKDWRKVFGHVPVPEDCSEETLIIPNTSGSIDWEGKSATSSPTIVPVNPDSVS